MLLSIARFSAKGWLQAALAAAATALSAMFVPLLFPAVWVSSACVAMPALRHGWLFGARVGVAAFVMVAGVLWLATGAYAPAVGMLAGVWLPVLLVAMVLRSTVSLSSALLAAAGLGALVVLASYGLLGDPAAWWRTRLAGFAPEFEAWGIDAETADTMLAAMAQSLTLGLGMMVCIWTTLGLLLARAWQAGLYNPGGFGAAFRALRFGKTAALATAGLLVLGEAAAWPLLSALGWVLGVLFALQTLAVAHAVVHAGRLGSGWLIALYVLLVLGIPSIYPIAAFGMADNFVDVRRRWGGASA